MRASEPAHARCVDGEPRIISDPPLIVPIEELLAAGAARPSSSRRSAT